MTLIISFGLDSKGAMLLKSVSALFAETLIFSPLFNVAQANSELVI